MHYKLSIPNPLLITLDEPDFELLRNNNDDTPNLDFNNRTFHSSFTRHANASNKVIYLKQFHHI